MTNSIVNAAPMTIMQGIQDLSTRALVAEAEVLPTHLAKVYGYAKKGPTDPQLVVGASRSQMYGEASFDLRAPWATHATVLSNLLNAQGNSQMFQRVKPIDAAPPASLRLYLDVLATQVQEYQRGSDGMFVLGEDGRPVANGTNKVAGYIGKWVLDKIVPGQEDPDSNLFGIGERLPGDQTGGAAQSTKYPIMDLVVPDFGAYGNNNGIRLYAPTTLSSSPLDDRIVANEKVYPFRMACLARPDALTTARPVETLSGEQFVNISFKPGSLDRNTDTELYVGDVFLNAYQDIMNTNLPPQYGPFGQFHLYDANVEELLGLFAAAEFAHADAFSDLKGDADEEFRFNMVSAVNSNGVPYHTFQLVSTGDGAVRLSESSTLFASGGSDGTMSEALFAELVAAEVVEYANPNSILQDSARYPESVMYDSGFPLATKYAMASFIAVRKDTAVVLSTHDVLSPRLSASQESALAIALRTRLQMYPESDYFGTSVARGMIVGRCGKLIGSQYRKDLPLALEIASKAATYMGAGNGKWRSGASFDQAPASEVTMFTDINVSFTPATVRNKDWANGLVWVESFTRRGLYFPALKTVCDNDTSVLNSFFTMMACVELEKVGERARRQFSGVSSLTNAQLIERVNQFVTDNTIGRFDGRFVIQPNTYFTAADVARGYSWTLAIKIYAPNMKTVMTLSIQSYRIEDLTA